MSKVIPLLVVAQGLDLVTLTFNYYLLPIPQIESNPLPFLILSYAGILGMLLAKIAVTSIVICAGSLKRGIAVWLYPAGIGAGLVGAISNIYLTRHLILS